MSVRVWKIDRNAILARLARWASNLGQSENMLAVVLFGSLAQGDYTAASDADALIILRCSSCRFDERIPTFVPSNIGISVDVFPYTLDEAKRALEEGWGVVRVALEEGVVLFKRERVLEDLQLEIQEIQNEKCKVKNEKRIQRFTPHLNPLPSGEREG